MRFIGRAGAARNGVRQRRFRDVTVGVSKTPHPTDSSEADLYSQADVRGGLIRVEI